MECMYVYMHADVYVSSLSYVSYICHIHIHTYIHTYVQASGQILHSKTPYTFYIEVSGCTCVHAMHMFYHAMYMCFVTYMG